MVEACYGTLKRGVLSPSGDGPVLLEYGRLNRERLGDVSLGGL